MTTPEQSKDLRAKYRLQTAHAIVEAYVSLVEERETDAVSMADVAARAGTSERTVHRHYPTRVDLYAAAGEYINSEVFGLIEMSCCATYRMSTRASSSSTSADQGWRC